MSGRDARVEGPRPPAAYVVFDLLVVDGTDIRPKPYSARRALLEDLFARRLPNGFVLMPTTNNIYSEIR
jgi:ATP-dependent DNA ligase